MEGKDKVRLSYNFLDRDRLKRSFEDVVDRTLRLGDGQSRACSLRRPEGQLGGAGTHFDFSKGGTKLGQGQKKVRWCQCICFRLEVRSERRERACGVWFVWEDKMRGKS